MSFSIVGSMREGRGAGEREALFFREIWLMEMDVAMEDVRR